MVKTPPGTSIQMEFQGASAVAPGSKEVDPGSLTAWGAAPSVANGLQFLRWRVQFDLAATPGSTVGPDTPRPAVQALRIRATY